MVTVPTQKTLPVCELKRVLQLHFRRFVTAVEFTTHDGAPALRVTFADQPQTARVLSFR